MQGGAKRAGCVGVVMIVWCVLSGLHMLPVASAHHGDHAVGTHVDASVPQLLKMYDCTACHRFTEPHRMVGPSLWKLSERAEAAAIRAALLTPDAVVTPGYPAGIMRARLEQIGFYTDIARQPDILDRLVAYLAGTAVPAPVPAPKQAAPGPSVDTTPVTKAQYAAFIADHGYGTKRYWDRTGWAIVVQRRQRIHPPGWQAERDATSHEPVVGMSWYEAEAYCHWAGKELPTEQEWQRHCQETPEWQGPVPGTNLQWEWTAEATWRGGQGRADGERCTARAPSYRALDGRHTGFRCRVVGAAPAASGK